MPCPSHCLDRERISGGDYSFPSDIWSFGLTILAVALGRYPFVSPKSARSLSNSGEVITEGDGGYWAILQAIQERPSIKSLLASCQHNCEKHSHVPSGYLRESSSPPAADGASSPSFSKSFHSFLSQCLQKDPKQRPTAHALLQHPFLQRYAVNTTLKMADDFSLTPASHLTDDFIHQACLKHKDNMEAKAISARNRLNCPGLFGNSVELQVPRSGEKTADNNVPHRRRLRQNSEMDTSSSSQDEGIKQLRTVLKAYREYLNRTWGKKIGLTSASAAHGSYHITSIQTAEKIIRATLSPLHSTIVLTNISDALNVPFDVVKRSFQKIIRELKEHVTANAAVSNLMASGSKSNSSSLTRNSLTAMFEKGFSLTNESEETPPAVRTPQTLVSPEKLKNSTPKQSLATTFEEGNFESIPLFQEGNTSGDQLDRSDGSDVAAVEELRALMNTRSKATATMDRNEISMAAANEMDGCEEYSTRILQDSSRSEPFSCHQDDHLQGELTTHEDPSSDDLEEEEFLPSYPSKNVEGFHLNRDLSPLSKMEEIPVGEKDDEMEEGVEVGDQDPGLEEDNYDDDFEDDPI